MTNVLPKNAATKHDSQNNVCLLLSCSAADLVFRLLHFYLMPILQIACVAYIVFLLKSLFIAHRGALLRPIICYDFNILERAEKQTANFLGLLKLPGVCVLFLHCCVTCIAFTYLEPVLGPYMEKTVSEIACTCYLYTEDRSSVG